jgi:Mlc titration factor MtfA (ptsG expression regulator)
MKLFILLMVVGLSVWAGFFIKGFRRQQKRRLLLSSPFPPAWDAILKKNLPPYTNLPPDLLQQLQDATRIFVAEKSFEGCGGLTLTDEIKVTIAAQACMLLLNRRMDYYPNLYSILVYPSAYVADTRPTIRGQSQQASARLGESWHSGAVVLAWDSVRHGAANFNDGHNVTMHEFAHQLDQHYGAADGAPVLASRSAYSAWAQVFSKEYELLRHKTAKGRKTVMDSYGATNPAEFFAVATETFFEKPRQLKSKHPELYEELYGFYRVNPIEWE